MVIHPPQHNTNAPEQSVEIDSRSPPQASLSVYKSLSQDQDCMRLLQIHSAAKKDDPIACNLNEVTFGERPKFDALSYMWGSSQVERSITLNGVLVSIRQNLWDALYYLREQAPGTSYWIDAICINQKDIAERNRQVRIMHHIYSGAQTVVVWLGKGYDTYDPTLPILQHLTHNKPHGEGIQQERPTYQLSKDSAATEQQLAKDLYKDPYWSRVWIIQEIGHARRIKVCFGSVVAIDWNPFTHFIGSHNVGSDGPLRLKHQREDKHTGSTTLLQLLQAHKDAACQDRKDKVYGLVGLASDARNFVIDYKRSVFEIWTDVMVFMNRQGLFADKDIGFVGHLVKFLLMDTIDSPLEQIKRQYEPASGEDTIITNIDHPKAFKLPAAMLGCVIHVGPHPHEIVGNLNTVDKWTEHVQANYKKDSKDAHRESDTIIRAMIDLDDVSLSKKCFDYRSTIQWQAMGKSFENITHSGLDDWIETLQQESNIQIDSDRPHTKCSLASHSRLFQMSYQSYAHRKLGLASSDIQVGDLVFWLRWPRRAVVVRVCGQRGRYCTLQVVGTAVVTDDLGESQLGCSQRKDWSDNLFKMDLYLDAGTIFILLA
ncbi:heterokaryon incompatibility protein-domain-containing protein [Fusarium avenaceum]|nr:heterokaryon incompatibility protein-domain-containing protein [Fusarium avenaceum]